MHMHTYIKHPIYTTKKNCTKTWKLLHNTALVYKKIINSKNPYSTNYAQLCNDHLSWSKKTKQIKI